MPVYHLIKTDLGYGIQITYENDTLHIIPNITCSSTQLAQLIEKCTRLQVSLLHIDDIIYDFLCTE